MPPPQHQSIAADAAASKGFSDCIYHGAGAFKETYRVTDIGGQYYALKVVDRSKIDAERTAREIDALRTCSSPNIATIQDFFIQRDSNGVEFDIIVEEFFGGGTFEQRTAQQHPTREELKSLGLGLAKAVEELQRHNLVHRDIKPANIMFRDASVEPVLVDFGIVRDLNRSAITQSWLPQGPCTPRYAAPEQLLNDRSLIDWRTDQFSIGVVLSYGYLGVHPYDSPPTPLSDSVAGRQQAQSFITAAVRADKSALVKMTSPWPIGRYSSISDLINALNSF